MLSMSPERSLSPPPQLCVWGFVAHEPWLCQFFLIGVVFEARFSIFLRIFAIRTYKIKVLPLFIGAKTVKWRLSQVLRLPWYL